MIVLDDILNRISERKLIELTNDDPNANEYDIVKINDAIEKAISLVKAYLKGTDYENKNEPFIKEIALDIAVYFLYKKRFSEIELSNPENLAIYKNYQNAIDMLEKIREGKLNQRRIEAKGSKHD